MGWDRKSVLSIGFVLVGLMTSTVRAEEGRKPVPEKPDYNRHVQPILARYCFSCHGQDEKHREAGLRLDQRAGATKKLDSDLTAVVPGHPEKSELLRRIRSTDADERMPPKSIGKTLTADEIAVLTNWIKSGATYSRHWAFVKPRRHAVPAVKQMDWPKSILDHFVLARIERAGLQPSPAADRYTLIRRLSFDLRGIPPTLAELQFFVNDRRPDAYEQLVERFLSDPRYGERWARVWLDLARYADSRGYGSDPLRPNIWRYRDWVIDAFNQNLPYDQFTVNQLAGDLLPNATLDQKIATAFHRNTMTNTEGGTDDEEFRVAAVRDRVDTTVQVWMGLTMGCAKCHNHKYDPIRQKEYYQFYAIFNQTADNDQPNEAPVISAPRRRDLLEIARIEARIAELNRQLNAPSSQRAKEQREWEQKFRDKGKTQQKARYVRIELPGPRKMLSLAEVQVFSGGKNVALNAKAKQSSTDYNGPAKLAVDGNTIGDFNAAKSTTHTRQESNPWWEVDLGKSIPIEKVLIWNRTDNNLQSRIAQFQILLFDEKRNTVWRKAGNPAPKLSATITPGGIRTSVPAKLLAIIDTPLEKRTAAQKTQLANHFQSIAPSLKTIRNEIARLQKVKPKLPTVPVMQELPTQKHRKTFLMVKGNFLEKGESVKPGIPAAFHAFPKNAPSNRLGVARWIIHPDNPLTARVAVNRFWARLFGKGIVQTEEDFGTQGEQPSHPELLDWLAVEFQQQEWDIKRFLKMVVLSSTYRQSSRVTALHLKRDPSNRLLARFPRVRLEAEMVRDQALVLSGLLSTKMNGPSVYPPQPPGLWRAAFNGQRKWPTSKGDDKYRRGLYTFWRRTVPYPSMATFDAPSREICTVRRIRTNTPLQAFVTLNDPVYVEAAQALARRIVQQGGRTVDDRVKFALTLCLVQPPAPAQINAVKRLYDSELAHYRKDIANAKKIATDPLGPLPTGMLPDDLAAWTIVANVLLNLDAVLMRK